MLVSPEFISLLPLMLPSSPLPKHLTKPTPFQSSPSLVSNLTIKWSSAILDKENTWHVRYSTEEMLSPRMSTLPSLPSRPNELFNSSIGVPLDSKFVYSSPSPSHAFLVSQFCRANESNQLFHDSLVSATNLQRTYQEEILLRFLDRYACYPTRLLSPLLGVDWITSSIYSTPNELSFIGSLLHLALPFHLPICIATSYYITTLE